MRQRLGHAQCDRVPVRRTAHGQATLTGGRSNLVSARRRQGTTTHPQPRICLGVPFLLRRYRPLQRLSDSEWVPSSSTGSFYLCDSAGQALGTPADSHVLVMRIFRVPSWDSGWTPTPVTPSRLPLPAPYVPPKGQPATPMILSRFSTPGKGATAQHFRSHPPRPCHVIPCLVRVCKRMRHNAPTWLVCG
jgi:hypothetical protein